MRYFALPLALTMAIVATAPPMRNVVKALVSALGPAFAPTLTALLALSSATVLLLATREIGKGRAHRFGLLFFGLFLVIAGAVLFDRGPQNQIAVERFHLLLYAGVAALFYRAFLRSGHRVATIPLTLGAVSLAALLDEWVQWRVAFRTGELFDVAVDVFAGVAGVLGASAVWPLSCPGPVHPFRWRNSVFMMAALPVAAALFVDSVHLGHTIDDPEVGIFLSGFSKRELQDRAQNLPRATASWLGAYRPEDFYRNEAVWHFRERNRARAKGDLLRAHGESMILAKYFGAFAFAAYSRFHNALDASEREQLAGILTTEKPFRSRVDGGLLWTRFSRSELWSAALVIASVGLLVGTAIPTPLPASRSHPPSSLRERPGSHR